MYLFEKIVQHARKFVKYLLKSLVVNNKLQINFSDNHRGYYCSNSILRTVYQGNHRREIHENFATISSC